VILYIMLTGNPPFSAPNGEQILKKARLDQLEFRHSVWAIITKEARDLIIGMLEKDPAKRITANEALKHPWIANRLQRSSLDEKHLADTVENLGSFRKVTNFQ